MSDLIYIDLSFMFFFVSNLFYMIPLLLILWYSILKF